MMKNKPRLYNKEITAYYIPWASKFAASDNKGQPDIILHKLGRLPPVEVNRRTKQQTEPIALQHSSRKVSPAQELQRKQLSNLMRLRFFGAHIHQLKLHSINKRHILTVNLAQRLELQSYLSGSMYFCLNFRLKKSNRFRRRLHRACVTE